MDKFEGSILVVEDEPALRRLAAQTIRMALPHCRVLEASDGIEAARLAEETYPAVVITDLRMPRMDGFELCRLLKGRYPNGAVTIIAMTGEPTGRNVDEIRRCGADACLLKPFGMDELIQQVEAALKAFFGRL